MITDADVLPIDGRSQLEAEYIQRCLGNLTPLQESQLIQLRTMVSELVKGKVGYSEYKIPSPDDHKHTSSRFSRFLE